jgi:hypothetical protein
VGPIAASVDRLAGIVDWKAAGSASVRLGPNAAGKPVPAGSEIETRIATDGTGGVALRMAGGASLRLDKGTRARIASARVVELRQGAAYVDTGGGPRKGDEVAILTTAGLFQGLGTQFEVRCEPGGPVTRLRVREGSVRMERPEESVLTGAGQELIVARDGNLTRRPIRTFGPDWDWVVRSAPVPPIEGVTVRAFLDWVSRETGWRVELADRETASLCDTTILHGTIDTLTAAEAPDVVLPSAGLGHRFSDGVLFVSSSGR